MKKICTIWLIFCCFIIINCSSANYISLKSERYIMGNNEIKIGEGVKYNKEEKKIEVCKWIYPVKEHEVELSEYKIGRNKITNKEYEKFLRAVRKKTIKSYRGEEKGEDPNKPVEVTVYEALAYCQWMSDRTGKEYRLPTSAEWEYAFTGGKKQKYPWGNEQRILESLGRKDIVKGNSVAIDVVKEDKGWSGIENAGGGEIILDEVRHYYENQNINKKNPLSINANYSFFSIRGAGDYNDFNNKFGIYDYKPAFFSFFEDQNFRLVEGIGSIFSFDEENNCIFYQNTAFFDKNFIYSKPFLHCKKKIHFMPVDKRCLVLYKCKNEEGIWYRIYYPIQNNFDGNKSWDASWINEKNIEITNKKWYGETWDWYLKYYK